MIFEALDLVLSQSSGQKEAAYEQNEWTPGWLLSLAGLITVISILASLLAAR